MINKKLSLFDINTDENTGFRDISKDDPNYTLRRDWHIWNLAHIEWNDCTCWNWCGADSGRMSDVDASRDRR